jgi:hypothetical protein
MREMDGLWAPLDEVGSSAHVRFERFRLLSPLAQTDGGWDNGAAAAEVVVLAGWVWQDEAARHSQQD